MSGHRAKLDRLLRLTCNAVILSEVTHGLIVSHAVEGPAVVCSCCHPERVFRARRIPTNSNLLQPSTHFSHKTLAVACSCCHPERVFRARRIPTNSNLLQPSTHFSHKTLAVACSCSSFWRGPNPWRRAAIRCAGGVSLCAPPGRLTFEVRHEDASPCPLVVASCVRCPCSGCVGVAALRGWRCARCECAKTKRRRDRCR